jgi:large subunit ribosomal protein L17
VRHRKAGRQLGRNSSHRRALYRSLVTSLMQHERIETTEAKAKEIRVFADQMISLGKEKTLAARRRALAFLQSALTVKKLFDEVAPRFESRNGGYTRLIKTRSRVGDGAPMVLVELVEMKKEEKKQEQKAKVKEEEKTAKTAKAAS